MISTGGIPAGIWDGSGTQQGTTSFHACMCWDPMGSPGDPSLPFLLKRHSFLDNMAFAFWAFLALVVVVIQAAPVIVEEEPWNAEVNFGPEENFRGKSRRSTGNH